MRSDIVLSAPVPLLGDLTDGGGTPAALGLFVSNKKPVFFD
jgi:hypothetical protein